MPFEIIIRYCQVGFYDFIVMNDWDEHNLILFSLVRQFRYPIGRILCVKQECEKKKKKKKTPLIFDYFISESRLAQLGNKSNNGNDLNIHVSIMFGTLFANNCLYKEGGGGGGDWSSL